MFLFRFLIVLIVFSVSGCQALREKFNRVPPSKEAQVVKSGVKVQEKQEKVEEKVEQGGYLTRGVVTVTAEDIKDNTEEGGTLEISASLKDRLKKENKEELIKRVLELDALFTEEKKIKDRALDELSKYRVDFQKHLFELENILEMEKQKNKKLHEDFVKAELDQIKAKQELENIKTKLILKRNLFQSAYPVFYNVQKGDSLWKISERPEIFNNPYLWLEIFYANKEKLESKDLIYPGMVLKIPRFHEYLLSGFDREENLGASVINNADNNKDSVEDLT